ncbi:hypothetical protein BLNAU_16233 [Blattamonas nauphoetae]|uniref:Uncharacterized protein n=1 Tax=Blattamonas nauphoetae TaxID=2049346 RepID=A0ABQ9XC24_9EUKA|nr:hypothetical protein BLNAU_16233 [Blattamonas nauphoetae]
MIVLLTLFHNLHSMDADYRDFKTIFAEKSHGNSNDWNSEERVIQFESGWFSTESFPIVSRRMEFRGNMTRLSGKLDSQESSVGYLAIKAIRGPTPIKRPNLLLLDVQNSTLHMNSWILDVEESGWSACLLSSSDLTIEGSEIVSNMERSPFIVTDDFDGQGCQIMIIRSSHKSTSNLVLPLADTSQNPRETDIGRQMMNDATADDESRLSVSVNGVGLLMNNQLFPLGTGPLFTFHSPRAFDCALDVETSLLQSNLVNVSSSSVFSQKEPQFGSGVCQRVVGSCVRKSTNHASGTGMMSPNLGGNLVCLNTSFSHCQRASNEPKDFANENITQTHIGRLNNVTSTVTSGPK